MTESGIYVIKNTVNNHMYVGQAKDLPHRWTMHKSALRGGYHHNRHLQFAWNLYGESAFSFEVLEYCEYQQLDDREQYYLDIHAGQDYCYNFALYPDNPMKGRKHTPDNRAKMSIRSSGKNNAMFGKKHSHITRQKIAAKAKGGKRRLGAVLSDETKQKISKSLKGVGAGAKNPRNKITPELVAWVSLLLSEGVYQMDIAKEFGISQTTVSKIKRGKTYLSDNAE